MKTLVVLAHPDENSFNHAIAMKTIEALKKNGHTVLFHDLYKEEFTPCLPANEIPREAPLPGNIAIHCEEAATADGIIVIHPNWWGMPPAILAGWVDRVMRPGVAYEFVEGDSGEGVPAGLLKARKALVFNTANTSQEREENIFGDPLDRIWKDCVFDLCGVQDVTRRMFRIIVTSTEEQRQTWLAEVADMVDKAFPAA